jgi:hypothetical protein
MTKSQVFEGVHCTMRVAELAPRVLLVKISGRDVGEHGDAPMTTLGRLLPPSGKVEVFIDAREAMGPSTDVSAAWAQWLATNKPSFAAISMLTGTRFLQMTAGFVRKYAELGDVMRIYTDPSAFDTALSLSLASNAEK